MTNWTPSLEGRPGPLYRVIADALADDIADGTLPVGSRLPTHRDLAFRLGVTVGTVTRAYAEAEKRGLIGGEVGRGTFVQGQRPPPAPLPITWPPAGGNTADAVVNMTTVHPEHAVAVQTFGQTLIDIAASGRAATLIGYGPHAGLPEHRAAIAAWLERQHRVRTGPDSVLLTNGAQNALAVAFGAVARPGDVILAERLTNIGTKALAATQGYHLEGVPIDEHGLVPAAFDSACRRLGPKAAYLVPTLQNPTAVVMPTARRREIIEIARRYGVVLIEDDVFGFMVPDAEPIHGMAPDITLYVSSVSKSLAAGLRLGFIVAPPELRSRAEATIRALQYSAPALPAEVAARWIQDGTADRIVATQREEDLARQRLARSILPADAVCGHPAAQHLWLVLPEPWRREDFIAEARRRGVIVTGADAFAVGRASAPHAVRLGLCMPRGRDEAARGLRALADALDAPAAAMLSIV
ncbi:aminotransferase-like domain-containing protein [Azospirillum picis]|uniref:DNA-binding transcriptional MocR family regulator n=1 Tax=Azospirillum picis TaxID=488438 RepID=A0ABU0MNY7_9PROT|nr:PLP-dependent aminotransferase family protein [Azospirillum picis]MBP2301341.1 DNA-binding transcriptional MocR family regulator [Azospirillum picis]MDQ0535172.1 DNA-binding transcriptional MocR family regulator [Azospirillum picis]